MTKRPPWAEFDPYYEREARKYDNPVPSREYILQLLEERGAPASLEHVCEALGAVDEDDVVGVSRRLGAMVRAGQLVENRRKGYMPVSKVDLIRGRVIAHPDGFGFLAPEDGSRDLFLHAKQMRQLLHGDRILAHVRGEDQRGRKEAAVVEVVERANTRLVGRFIEEDGICLVAPDNKRIHQDIVIPNDATAGATDGQIVVAAIEVQPSKHRPPLGRVVEVLGEHMDPGMEIDIAIRSHGLPNDWPQGVLDQIANLTPEVAEQDKQGRTDLRDLPLVTIDGSDARDFDDAVYAKRTWRGWKLWVAIADVSHYVTPDSELDKEAYERGNSVYFPERVIPMLPEVLSNGLCSLNPEVDRLAMVCEMVISRKGELKSTRMYRAVFRSHARLIYDDVAALLKGDEALRKQYSALVPHLETLNDLYKAFTAARKRRGSIDFETTETRIVYGEDRKIERIVPVVRNDAHKIIEECMLAANVATAGWLRRKRMPVLYRVHDGAKTDKLPDVREFLKEFGLTLKGGDTPGPKDYSRTLAAARKRQEEGHQDFNLIQTVLLRSMSQAVYTPENKGHFGLSYSEYLHFTSPIRRYPDLLTHRAIGHVLDGGKPKNFVYQAADMEVFGDHCSMTERRADDATRDAVAWLKCEFMLDRVGESFSGTITSVTAFGLFVELDEIYVEGLVHVTSLKSDYYHFDAAGHRMQGERSGRSYRLGDRIDVQVVRVDLDQRKIDFQPLDAEGDSASARPSRRQSSKKSSAGKKSGGKKTAGKKTAHKKTGEGGKKKPAADGNKRGSRRPRRRGGKAGKGHSE